MPGHGIRFVSARSAAWVLVLGALAMTAVAQESANIQLTKPLPEFLQVDAPVLESIALKGSGLHPKSLQPGESIVTIDRFFAWGGVWDQAVLFLRNDKPTLCFYGRDSTEAPIGGQLKEMRAQNPDLSPLVQADRLRFERRRPTTRILPIHLTQAMRPLLAELELSPTISSHAVDVHLVLIRVQTTKGSWWALRDETQRANGYGWAASVLEYSRAHSRKRRRG